MRVYLDHNATTPMSAAALARYAELSAGAWANPSSTHAAGHAARRAIEEARAAVARLVGARPAEVVFTAGGTEADVTAAWAIAAARRRAGAGPAVLVTVATEHHAVLHAVEQLEALGLAVERRLGVDAEGALDLDRLGEALVGAEGLFLMWANNETGACAPIDAVGALVEASGVWWHCDAVQAAGKIPIDLDAGGARAITTLALAGHKLCGPKGVGALLVRHGTALTPLLPGGGQEAGRRGGTLNTPGIGAFGVAADEANAHLQRGAAAHTAALRDRLQAALLDLAPASRLNGPPDRRLPNTLNLSLAREPGAWLDGEDVMLALSRRGVAASTGAACASGARQPSHVLTAMGRSPAEAHASLRLSLGLHTSSADIEEALAALAQALDEVG